MVDQVVSMNEQVSEGNNPRVISHSGSYIRVITGQAIHGLADNFEVAFERGPE
jgi:hypothetical protein